MKIKLNSGTEVFVEAYHRTNSYAGLILGIPSVESNQRLINHLSYPKDWGERVCIMKKSESKPQIQLPKPQTISGTIKSPCAEKKTIAPDAWKPCKQKDT